MSPVYRASSLTETDFALVSYEKIQPGSIFTRLFALAFFSFENLS